MQGKTMKRKRTERKKIEKKGTEDKKNWRKSDECTKGEEAFKWRQMKQK